MAGDVSLDHTTRVWTPLIGQGQHPGPTLSTAASGNQLFRRYSVAIKPAGDGIALPIRRRLCAIVRETAKPLPPDTDGHHKSQASG